MTNRLSNRLEQTPSQTVGPFFAYGLTPEQYGYDFKSIATPSLVSEKTQGEHIRLTGQVLDGEGAPVNDAMIEIRQADADGQFGNASFLGFGRCGTGTDPDNRFFFNTIKPGQVDNKQAPHIEVIIFMRGLPSHLFTRIYFDDESEPNAIDPIFASVPENRRETLIARRKETSSGITYQIDFHMQGGQETVFFDI